MSFILSTNLRSSLADKDCRPYPNILLYLNILFYLVLLLLFIILLLHFFSNPYDNDNQPLDLTKHLRHLASACRHRRRQLKLFRNYNSVIRACAADSQWRLRTGRECCQGCGSGVLRWTGGRRGSINVE